MVTAQLPMRQGGRRSASIRKAGLSGLNPETALYAQANGGLDGSVIAALDQFISDCRSDGTRGLIDVVLPLMGPNWQSALIPLIHPRGPVKLPSVNFTAADYVATGLNSGFTGDGSSKYIQSVFWPYLQPLQYSGGSFFLFANPPASGASASTEKEDIGIQNWIQMELFSNANSQLVKGNWGSASSPAGGGIPPWDCVYAGVQIGNLANGPGVANFYKNGVLAYTHTATSATDTVPPAWQPFLFALNGASSGSANTLTPAQYSNSTIGFVVIAAAMPAAQVQLITNRIIKLLSNPAIGRYPNQRLNRSYHIIGLSGQSVGAGYLSVVVRTQRQLYLNRCYNGGPYVYSGNAEPPPPAGAAIPLAESPNDGGAFGETCCSGFANSLSLNTGANFFVTGNPINSQPYSYMAPGTLPYASLIQLLQTAYTEITADGGTADVPWVNIVHGEADATNTNYNANLATWQSSLTSSVQAFTGQSSQCCIGISQCCSYTSTGAGSFTYTQPSDLLQLAAYIANPQKIVLCCPRYLFAHDPTDGEHILPASGETWLGEYYAKGYYYTVTLKSTFVPLYPISASISGSNITVVFSRGGLQFDTSYVSDPSGTYASIDPSGAAITAILQILGIEYAEVNGGGNPSQSINALNGVSVSTPPTTGQISSINAAFTTTNITGDTLTIGLTGTPTGTQQEVRFAFTGTAGAVAGPTTGTRCCLRDSDTSWSGTIGNFWYNYELAATIAV